MLESFFPDKASQKLPPAEEVGTERLDDPVVPEVCVPALAASAARTA